MSNSAFRYLPRKQGRTLQLRRDLADQRRIDALVADLAEPGSPLMRDIMSANVSPAAMDCAGLLSSQSRARQEAD